jgi:hypothetical protein
VSTVKSHDNKQLSKSSTIEMSAKVVVELNQRAESSDMEREVIHLEEK